MIYLLDTSACIDYIKRQDSVMRRWLSSGVLPFTYLCSVVQGELLVGVRKMPTERNLREVYEFLNKFESWPYDEDAAEVFATIRAELELKGQKIGPYDVQIAAIAIAHDATLVTGDMKGFQRIPSLRCLYLKDIESSINLRE